MAIGFPHWQMVGLWFLIPSFPVGVLRVFCGPDWSKYDVGHLPLWIGWPFYILFTYVLLRSRKRAAFYVAFFVLFVILALNVGGCRIALNEFHD